METLKRSWTAPHVQREFLEQISLKFGIRKPSDWGKITVQDVKSSGGNAPIVHQFHGSLIRMLKSAYPEIEWKSDWFSNHIRWNNKNSQREFFTKLAKKLSFKKPSDWGRLTTALARKYGASTVLGHYGGSLFRALSSAFPEENWEEEWFEKVPQGHWKSKENQKVLFDKLAIEFGIQHPSDWGKISVRQILQKERTSSVVCNIYKNSLFTALSTIYSTTEWKREWFPTISKYPPGYWNNTNNQRSFLEIIALKYNLQSRMDWHRVSSALIKKHGGNLLLMKYHNSLGLALRTLFPGMQMDMEEPKLHGVSSKAHSIVTHQLSRWT